MSSLRTLTKFTTSKTTNIVPKSILIKSYQTSPFNEPRPSHTTNDRSYMGSQSKIPGPGLKLPSNNVLLLLGGIGLGLTWYEWDWITSTGQYSKENKKKGGEILGARGGSV